MIPLASNLITTAMVVVSGQQPPPPVVDALEELRSLAPLARERGRRTLFSEGDVGRAILLDQLPRGSVREQWLYLELVRELARSEDADTLSPLVSSAHPTVASIAAAALARVDPNHPAAAALLREALPVVVGAFLEEVLRQPLATRIEFSTRHSELLLGRLAGPEPGLRQQTRELLAEVDDPSVAQRFLVLADSFVPAEREHLLDLLLARTPRWPRPLLIELLKKWSQHSEFRQRCTTLRLLLTDEPRDRFIARHLRESLGTALGPAGPERDAALLFFAAMSRDRDGTIAALLPEFIESPRFDEGLDLVLRLRGPEALGDLVGLAETLSRHPGRAAQRAMGEVFATLPRLASTRTTEACVSLIPHLEDHAWKPLVEAAFRLPPSDARTEILLNGLQRPQPETRLRAFQGLAESLIPVPVDPLHDAVVREDQPQIRKRMLALLCEHFGASARNRIVDLLSWLIDEGSDLDRQAALTAVPLIPLGEKAEAVAGFLMANFEASEPDRLFLAVSQIHLPSAELLFFRLCGAPSQENTELDRFLLRQGGRLQGPQSLQVLQDALDDPDDKVRALALRSLIERGESVVLLRGAEVLESLPSLSRTALLGGLGGLDDQPEFEAFLVDLLERLSADDARIALLEVGVRRHGEALLPFIARTLEADNGTLTLAALEALGSVAQARSRQLLLAEADKVCASGPLTDAGRAVLRTVALALHRIGAEESIGLVAQLILEPAAESTASQLQQTVLSTDLEAPELDPMLVRALAESPPTLATGALEQAAAELFPADRWIDERTFLRCADLAVSRGAQPELVEWFDQRVIQTWPSRSFLDLRVVTRPYRSVLARGDLEAATESLFADLPRVVAAYEGNRISPRQEEMCFGRRDPYHSWNPRRTLACLSVLAEGGSQGKWDAATLRRAAREADPDARLTVSLAEIARSSDPDLARELARAARVQAPFLPDALDTAAWIEHESGRVAARDELRAELAAVLHSGLARSRPRHRLREAVYLLESGDEREAIREARRAFAAEPALSKLLEGKAFADLRSKLQPGGF